MAVGCAFLSHCFEGQHYLVSTLFNENTYYALVIYAAGNGHSLRTKVLWRNDYELIVNNRHHFGDFDPFGDFDLLFGATKVNLKMVDLPIRYQDRQCGTTNIQRWKHGWLLLRMVIFAAGRIKFL